jgi:hypothetical protein
MAPNTSTDKKKQMDQIFEKIFKECMVEVYAVDYSGYDEEDFHNTELTLELKAEIRKDNLVDNFVATWSLPNFPFGQQHRLDLQRQMLFGYDEDESDDESDDE